MAFLEKHIQQFFERQTFKTIWVGLSGGADSIVLLHVLKTALPQADIKAVHINHQLQTLAKEWEQFCEKICKQMNVEYLSISVDVKQDQGESVEAAAREARYQTFKNLIKENECVCTAHHEDDQAETFILQLMRGAGLTGLQSLLPRQLFGKGLLLRPLLEINKAEILAYAKTHRLDWIEDPMNLDISFDRVLLRQQVLPLLSKRWPAAKRKIAQSARLLQESQEVLTEITEQDYFSVLMGSELDCDKLKKLQLSHIKLVLRYWMKQAGFLLPSEKILKNVIDEVIYAAADASPLVTWKGAEVRRFQNKLYIMQPLLPIDRDLLVEWKTFPEAISLPNGMEKLDAEDFIFFNKQERQKLTDKQGITLRLRQGGEKTKVGAHHRQLKKILQEMNIEPWKRERIILLYKEEELIAMAIK